MPCVFQLCCSLLHGSQHPCPCAPTVVATTNCVQWSPNFFECHDNVLCQALAMIWLQLIDSNCTQPFMHQFSGCHAHGWWKVLVVWLCWCTEPATLFLITLKHKFTAWQTFDWLADHLLASQCKSFLNLEWMNWRGWVVLWSDMPWNLCLRVSVSILLPPQYW